jgi:hypothetical protein
MVTIGHDAGLVIKQRIQDMQRFAGGCWDRLAEVVAKAA